MILKAVTVILLLSYSSARQFKYQECIIMDLVTDNMLTWTDSNGTVIEDDSVTFNSSSIQAGTCAVKPGDVPNLVLEWQSGAIMQLYFQNTSNSVDIVWQLQYTPNVIFKNGDEGLVTHGGNITAGHTDKAYVCDDEPEINDEEEAGNNTYKFTITFSEAKWQAFNVKDGKYSDSVEECGADDATTVNPTTEPPTTQPNPTTEKPTTNPNPTSEKPTSEKPTSEKPTSEKPTSEKPTSEKPTSEKPTTEGPTSAAPTTATTTLAPSADPMQTFDGQDNGTTCIVLQGKFLFTVNYPKNGSETGSTKVGVHDVHDTIGDCGAKPGLNMLTVDFYDGWKMMVEFGSGKDSALLTASDDDDDNTFWWNQVNLTYTYDEKIMPGLNESFQGKSDTLSADLNKQFKASTDGSYKCTSESDISFPGGGQLAVSELQYMAFQQNKTAFPSDNLSECSDDSGTSSVVPIAVGAALAGLVVIVLIAYLIGRKRNRKGYESV